MHAVLQSAGQFFLERTLAGEHVWMNPPFRDLRRFIQHYVDQKQRAPSSTNACIMVPDWRQAHHPALRDMQLIAQFEKGQPIFTAPAPDGTRQASRGFPGVSRYSMTRLSPRCMRPFDRTRIASAWV